MNTFDQLFNALKIKEEALRNEIQEVAEVQQVPKNTSIIDQGGYIKWLAIVIKGEVRVWQENEDREILLYNVNPVETCVLSLSAVFREGISLVNAKTKSETILIKIPVRFVRLWAFNYISWQNFTNNTFINSYDHLLSAYKDLAFKNLNERLLQYLKQKVRGQNTNVIHLSHSTLAKEFGTTREVISRILKQFEHNGIVKLGFKEIRLLEYKE